MTRRQDQALALVGKTRTALDQATAAKTTATQEFHAAIVAARDAGLDTGQIAPVAGVSRARVTQIAPVAIAPMPRAQAGKNTCADSRDAESSHVPTIAEHSADTNHGLSGFVSARKRTPYGRVTMFYRDGFGVVVEGRETRNAWLGWPDHENTIDGIITTAVSATREDVRVYVTGAAPFLENGAATQAEAVREWALTVPMGGQGWAATSHYLADPLLPVLRFKHDVTGQLVTIMRAASWWGETDADQATCAEAWRGLGLAIERDRLFAGAGLADSPATTGRALWLRSIPQDRTFPVLSDELRELIAATSGQGRIELRPAASAKAPAFSYLDGRFMYASLCHNMPVGEPTFWTTGEVEALDARGWTKTIRGRGRWRITATVPDTWHHVGMLMAPEAGGGWRYPSKPGERFETWADGAEVWAAQSWGWDVEVHEGFTFAEGKPLDTWAGKLLDIWKAAAAHADNSAAQLAARAVRSIVLYAIGAFASRTHPVTKSAPIESDPEVPAGVEVRRVGDSLVWEEPGKLSAWSAETAHPEWSATIWARARVRLLTGKGVNNANVGALYLPPEHIIGFATDALYLASPADWTDDGAPGRFRTKGSLSAPVPWPRSYAELWALRDKAEGAGL